jgi:predicted small secreted protein
MLHNRDWKGDAMKTIARILLLVTTLSLGSLTLTACNTMQGAGRDVEKAGQKLQDEAVEHKRY